MMNNQKFKGKTVECINDVSGFISGEKLLKKGQTYQVEDVCCNGDIIVNGIHGAWDSSRFIIIDDLRIDEMLESIINEINTSVLC